MIALFRRPDYQSEATRFLNQLKEQKPELAAQQQAGLALLWNGKADREVLREYSAARVPQQSYVYQTRS
jgi:hypothetical protein